MNFQELRVGNLIFNHKEEIICVNGLGIDGYILLDKEHNISDTMCKPIPLTEEWLIKLGFKKSVDSYFIQYDKIECVEVYCLSDGYYIYDNEKGSINTQPIKFVHQIQNWFYMFSGILMELSSNVA